MEHKGEIGWLVVLGFNATLTAKVISWRSVLPGFLTPELTQLSFQSHQLLFSYASAEVRGEKSLERKVTSIGYRAHDLQVMSSTCSPLSYQGWRNTKERLTAYCAQSYHDLHCPKKKKIRLYLALFFLGCILPSTCNHIVLDPLLFTK